MPQIPGIGRHGSWKQCITWGVATDLRRWRYSIPCGKVSVSLPKTGDSRRKKDGYIRYEGDYPDDRPYVPLGMGRLWKGRWVLMKNNNRKIITSLARKEYCADKGRRLVLMGAVAFAVMMLFSVFSFASGKIETDRLCAARKRGAVACSSLECVTQEQYEQILRLPYIKEAGKYVQFGNIQTARCVVADQLVWEKIKKPAFTDIHGTYPREKMEIMLPISALEWMGVSNPQVGMELPVTITYPKDSGQEEFQFRLSGYYMEYIDAIRYGPPDAYFSQAFLDSISQGREWDMPLIMRQEAITP